MSSRFSLATLLLLVAIAAFGIASMRTAIIDALAMLENSAVTFSYNPGVLVACLVTGSTLGLVFGTLFAAWNYRPVGWIFASGIGGCFLGAAAAAQCMVRMEWPILFVAPVVLIFGTLLVALNERRKRAAVSSARAEKW